MTSSIGRKVHQVAHTGVINNNKPIIMFNIKTILVIFCVNLVVVVASTSVDTNNTTTINNNYDLINGTATTIAVVSPTTTSNYPLASNSSSDSNSTLASVSDQMTELDDTTDEEDEELMAAIGVSNGKLADLEDFIGNLTQSLDEPTADNRTTATDYEKALSWPERQSVLTTTMSPQIRQQQEILNNSSAKVDNYDNNNNNNNTTDSTKMINETSTRSSPNDLVLDAVPFLANSSSTHNNNSLTRDNDSDDVDLLSDMAADQEADKTEAKSSGGDGLNDLEDSSSNVNVASVSAPQGSSSVAGKQQSASLTPVAKHQHPVSDQLSEPSTTRIHQVWTASTTSDVDELSPDIIGRMQNNVPFLAAYAVRPRLVRASVASQDSNSDSLSTSSSSLVMGQPAATASNVDYSEIQVESSSTTSHHHKKQTKLKRKKKSDLAGKSGVSRSAKQMNRRKKKPMRSQLSLAQKRKMINMASRSLKKRRGRRSRRGKQQQQQRKRTSGGGRRKLGKIKSKRAQGKASRISLMKRKLNRNNRLHHMNVLKYGRYQQPAESDGVDGQKSTIAQTDNGASDQIVPTKLEESMNDSNGATKGGGGGGATKGGAAGGRKSPFYSGAKPRNREEDSVVEDAVRNEQQDDEPSVKVDNRQQDDGDASLSSTDTKRPTENAEPSSLDSPENPEVVTVEPKYDGVDDDPEFFDDANQNGDNNGDRIDDVGEPKPNLDDNDDDNERKQTTQDNSQESNNDAPGNDDEKIDGDQGRAARRDRDPTQGNNQDDISPQTMSRANEDDDSVSSGGNHTPLDTTQGDKKQATGGEASVLGGGIGGAANSNGMMDDSLAGMDHVGNDPEMSKRDRADENDDFNNKDNDRADGDRDSDLDKTRVDEQEQDSFSGTRNNGNNNNNNNNDDNDTQDRSLERFNNDGDRDKQAGGGVDKHTGNKVDSNSGMVDSTDEGKGATGDDHSLDSRPAVAKDSDDNDLGNKKHSSGDDNDATVHDQVARDKHGNSGDDKDHHGHHSEHDYDHHGDSHCDHHGHHSHHDTIKWLQDAIPGEPNVDYPILWQVPKTKFNCRDQKYPGYYADVEARCQVFHVCQADGRQDSFLCPNGTIFSQTSSVCVWWNSFDCEDAPNLYERNSLLYKPMMSNGSGQMNLARGDGQQFDDFMGTFKRNGKRPNNGDSVPETDLMAGRGLASGDANRFDEDMTIQRKSTDAEDDIEIDQKTADLRSGPRRKRRASRQPPKLNPRRKPPTRTAIRRRLRHGAKPRGRRA